MQINLLSIQAGMPKTLQPVEDSVFPKKEWTTGFYKHPVQGSVEVHQEGIVGDGQADLVHHGGRDKAICVYPSEHYPAWESELKLDMNHGAFGENFTTAGAIEKDVCIGDIFQLGSVVVQITQPRQPCWKLARRWNIKDLALRVQETGRTGWYFRIIETGTITSPAILKLLERVHPDWSVDLANHIMHVDKNNWQTAAELAQVEALSGSWKNTLTKRAEKESIESSEKRLGDSSD